MTGRLTAAAGLAAGGALMWLAFRDVHPAQVLASARSFEPAWAPFLFSLPVLDLWIRALRWRILLAPVAAARTAKLFQLEAVGLALNNLLLMRLGELARAVLVGLELDCHAFAVLATIVVERLCDLAALLTLFAFGSWALSVDVDPGLSLAAAAGAAGISAVLAAAVRLESWLAALARERLGRWPRLAHLAEDMAAGARGLRAPGAWWRVGALSLGLWAVDAAVFWTAARALDLEPMLSYGRAVVVVTTAAAATGLPGAPGGFGNFEAAVKWILVHFGSAPGEAVAYAAFTHLVMYAVVTALGIVCLYRLGHTVEGLKKAVERLRHARRPGAKR